MIEKGVNMPHFFISSSSRNDNKIIISDNDNYNHIARSLRARRGEKLLLIDEKQIQYETIITNIDKHKIEVEIEKSYKSERDLKFNLYLAQSPLRSDAQNFVIEKATELGVRGIFPVVTDNCALNISIIDKKIEKWQKIMYEASKQCERAIVPECFEKTTLDAILNSKKFDKIIAFCERNADLTVRDFFNQAPVNAGDSLLLIIGPEGGFSPQEFSLFDKYKIPKLTLGNLILKAETAVTVALGNIIYEYENHKTN